VSPPPEVPGPDFRTLFESGPGLLLVLDPELRIVAVTDAYLDATMTSREAIVGRGIFEVFPDNPEQPDATGVANLRASLDRVRSAGVADTMAVQRYDIRRPDSDGGGFEERFWSPLNLPVFDSDGSLHFIIHRVEDVTEFVRLKHLESEQQRIAEELRTGKAAAEAEVYQRAQEIAETNRQLAQANVELRRSQVFLDSVIENIPVAVFVKDARDLRFVRFNRTEEELVGRTRQEVIGRSDSDFFPPDQAAFFNLKDREALDRGTVVDIPEEALDTPDHGRRILHTKKIPIHDEAGRPLYLVGISEDITARKQADQELRAAREEAERANRAKTEFLSQMSHELRTPLTAILGFSQLLEMDDLTDDQRTSVGHILTAGRHLLDLINEILDISRVETGQMTISAEPVAVAELLEEVVAVLTPLAASRRVAVGISVGRESHVMADRHRLRQVLMNVLSNAIKYNREGGTVSIASGAGDEGRFRIVVRDTGYGIPPEHLDRVFRPFDRLGAELGTVEGTGIGLALASGLVAAMGGSISVESALDVGSTFTVDLAIAEGPLERYERTAAAVDTSTRGGPRRVVLQIEDNQSNVRLVERIIQRRPGIELVTAADGRTGLELAARLTPDLILLDLHLPDLPGHDVLRELKLNAATRQIPVVVVSADATSAQVSRLLQSGVFGYLTKPLDVAEFLATVDRAIGADEPEPIG